MTRAIKAGLVRLDGRFPEDLPVRELCSSRARAPSTAAPRTSPPTAISTGSVDSSKLLAEKEVALLRPKRSGSVAAPRRARFEREHGRGEREQQACGEHQARDGAAHDPVDDRAPEAALPAGARRRVREERNAKRIHAVAEQREDGGEQGQRGDHGDDPDQDRAGCQAAEDRAGNEQEPEHREHERDPAEEDGTARGGAGGGDRIQLPSLLARAPPDSGRA